jgi:hypothetical protein
MTEDNDHLTMIPYFPKSDTEPTRHLTLITSGLGSSHLGGPGSIILMVMTTRLMSTLSEDVMQTKVHIPCTNYLFVLITSWYH